MKLSNIRSRFAPVTQTRGGIAIASEEHQPGQPAI